MTTTPSRPAGDSFDALRAFTFVGEDPDWIKKLLIGGLFGLLSMVIVGSFFLGGYFLRMIRRVARGEARPLPEWDDLGQMFWDGLRLAGLYLAYLGPLILIFVAGSCLVGLLGGGLAGLSRHSEGGSEAVGQLVGLGFMGFYGLSMLYMLLMAVFFPSALIRFALLERWASGFEFGELVGFIRRNLGGYLLALLLYIVASLSVYVGILFCCVGMFVASFWAQCVLGWALGEVVRRDAPLMAEAGIGR